MYANDGSIGSVCQIILVATLVGEVNYVLTLILDLASFSIYWSLKSMFS